MRSLFERLESAARMATDAGRGTELARRELVEIQRQIDRILDRHSANPRAGRTLVEGINGVSS